jgi:hypothetical protein
MLYQLNEKLLDSNADNIPSATEIEELLLYRIHIVSIYGELDYSGVTSLKIKV